MVITLRQVLAFVAFPDPAWINAPDDDAPCTAGPRTRPVDPAELMFDVRRRTRSCGRAARRAAHALPRQIRVTTLLPVLDASIENTCRPFAEADAFGLATP
ncbi:MAG: hypothetical protein IPM29_04540 [Planctomycetes bacterium]|nr:hypothetical protein [Planctomycetota bacterium]